MKKTEGRDIAKTDLQKTLTDEKESAFNKYKKIVTGEMSIGSILWFELVTMFLGNFPGAVGLFLRKLFYPSLFKNAGRNIVFGKNMTIRHPRKIQLGSNIIFDDNVVLDGKGTSNQGITIGNGVMMGRNTIISCKDGDITIGDNTNLSLNCAIHSENSVKIGSNVLFAAYCYVVGGGSHDFDRTDIPIIQQGSKSVGIIIENNCWLGAHVCILDGSKVEHDSVIAAGAVVKGNIPPFSIAGGIIAKVLKSRKQQTNPEE